MLTTGMSGMCRFNTSKERCSIAIQAPSIHGSQLVAHRSFMFDSVLDADATQTDVYYCGGVERMISSVLEGYVSIN